MEVPLCNAVSQRDHQFSSDLFDRRGQKIPKGRVTLTAEEIKSGMKDRVKIRFNASKLPKMDLFGKADPYFRILRSTASGSDWVTVYESEMYRKTYKPQWKP